MNGIHVSEERLNEYADGLLTSPEREEVDQHLVICDRCRNELRELSSLLLDLRALPKAIPPGEDLRPGIHARIRGAGSPRDPFSRRAILWSMRHQLAAAAVVLIVASSTLTLFLSQAAERSGPPVAAAGSGAASAGGDLAFAEFQLLEAEYLRAAGELRNALERREGVVDRTTAELLDRNLSVIDQAIRESRTALAADPHSEMLQQVVLTTYERKLEILRRTETFLAAS